MTIIELPKTKIEKSCDDGVGSRRPILEHVQIDLDKKRAVASNGFMLAVVPLESIVPDDETGRYLIHRELLEYRPQNKFVETRIDVSETGARKGNITIENEADRYDFPDADKVIPDVSDYELVAILDASKLLKLAQAICSAQHMAVKIYSKPGHLASALYVEPLKRSDKGFGVIMPCGVVGANKIDIQNLPTT